MYGLHLCKAQRLKIDKFLSVHRSIVCQSGEVDRKSWCCDIDHNCSWLQTLLHNPSITVCRARLRSVFEQFRAKLSTKTSLALSRNYTLDWSCGGFVIDQTLQTCEMFIFCSDHGVQRFLWSRNFLCNILLTVHVWYWTCGYMWSAYMLFTAISFGRSL